VNRTLVVFAVFVLILGILYAGTRGARSDEIRLSAEFEVVG